MQYVTHCITLAFFVCFPVQLFSVNKFLERINDYLRLKDEQLALNISAQRLDGYEVDGLNEEIDRVKLIFVIILSLFSILWSYFVAFQQKINRLTSFLSPEDILCWKYTFFLLQYIFCKSTQCIIHKKCIDVLCALKSGEEKKFHSKMWELRCHICVYFVLWM